MSDKNTQVKDKNIAETMATARLRYLRIAPRKVRLVANLIKKMSVNEAEAQLVMSSKRSAKAILKLLRSCVSNAKNKNMKEDKLFVDNIYVDEGPTLKRWMPRAMGRATPINKRTSHLTVVLKESENETENKYVISRDKTKKQKFKKAEKETRTKKTKNKMLTADLNKEDNGTEEKPEQTNEKVDVSKQNLMEKKTVKNVKDEAKLKQRKKGTETIKKLFRRKSV